MKVSKCGGGICGVIVWLRDPIDPRPASPQVDDKNPNPALTNAADDRPVTVQRHAARRRRTNGRARSTMPMTAAPMRSNVVGGGPATRCGSRAASARSAAARPGPASAGNTRLALSAIAFSAVAADGVAAARAVDEMHVIAAHHRRREAGHHRRVLPVQAVAHEPPLTPPLAQTLAQRALAARACNRGSCAGRRHICGSRNSRPPAAHSSSARNRRRLMPKRIKT